MDETPRVLLTKLELEVMRVIWNSGEDAMAVREVLEQVNRGREKELAYNTVQTVMNILRDKGVLEVTTGSGRAHDYRALVDRTELTGNLVGDLIERLFDGHAQPLLTHLVEQRKFSRDELRHLQRFIDERLEDEPQERGGAS